MQHHLDHFPPYKLGGHFSLTLPPVYKLQLENHRQLIYEPYFPLFSISNHYCYNYASTGMNDGTCTLIAPMSSSLLKGLVKYWSEPTIRPLALSKSPSLDESIITGVDLNAALFLISAHV